MLKLKYFTFLEFAFFCSKRNLSNLSQICLKWAIYVEKLWKNDEEYFSPSKKECEETNQPEKGKVCIRLYCPNLEDGKLALKTPSA